MKKISWLIALAALVAISAPAFAGGEKCSATDASACLSHWSSMKGGPWLGAKYDKAADGTISVKEVVAGSPAEKAGMKSGDILVALNGVSFADKDAIKQAKSSIKAGSKVTYTVKRGNAEKKLAVTMEPMPDAVFAQMVGDHVVANHMPAAPTAAAAEKTSQ